MAARKKTVAGKALPAGQEHLIPGRITDQGIERRNRELKAEHGTAKVTDRLDNQIDAYQAAADGKLEVWNAQNPLTEAVARVAKPGFRNRMLSPTVIEKRGMRGWEIAHDKQGREVKVGRLIAAEMPEAAGRERDAHYQNEGNEALRDAQETYQVQQERAIADGKSVGLAPLRPGEIVRDVRNRAHAASVGLHSHRGNSAIAELG